MLRQRLGRGVTGEVWRATDRLTDDDVAAKILNTCEDERATVRREIAALRVLHVRGVARFVDEGVDPVGPVVVMELVDGAPFPGGFTDHEGLASVTRRLLIVLGRVHALGLVHRDLKPANVLVTRDGHPVVLDFGLALGAVAARADDDRIAGTPAYLAPEQVLREPIDARADLYALGAMLFETVTGTLAFPDCATLDGIATRTRQPAPTVESLAPSTPRSLATLIDKLLATAPDDRPSSAAEALHVLEGGQSRTPGRKLPRLGDAAPLDAVLQAATAGRSIDVVGSRGSGRTRLLDDVAETLTARGRAVLRAVAGETPFESLRAVPASGGESLRERAERIAAETAERLAAGASLLVDDFERVDRWSAGLIEGWARDGAVVCARDEAAPGRAAVLLGPLAIDDLRGLFAGPERLLHTPSDAARALWNATSGLASRVAEEVEAWTRADLARWDDGRLVVDRAALDSLTSDLGPTLGALNRRRAAGTLFPARRPPLLEWICVAWPHTSTALLARALDRPVAQVTREVEELVARGDARVLVDGRVEPTAPSAPLTQPPWIARAQAALAAALPHGAEGRLFHLVAAARRSPEDPHWAPRIADETEAIARRRVDEGRHGEASAVLARGLRAVRDLASPETAAAAEERVLAAWVEVALGDVSPRSVDRVAYELCRVKAPSPRLTRMLALVEAALAARKDGARALDAAEAIDAFDDPALEWWRHAVRMLAARRASSERESAVLADVTTWASARGDADALRSVAAWRGRWMYRRGDYEDAARSHLEAAEGERNVTRRLGALTSAASAWLEALRLDDAERVARAAFDEARTLRHPYFEARAEWVLRAVRYRRGSDDRPDEDLLAAVVWLCESDLEALIFMTEAAFAWRSGLTARARELASHARRLWARAGMPPAALLMRCLAVAAGDAASSLEVEELQRAAMRCPLPRISAQCLGLLAPFNLVRAGERAPIVEAARRSIPEDRWDLRFEVLSLREVTRACEAAERAPRPASGRPRFKCRSAILWRHRARAATRRKTPP